jgi:predicted nuclease of predicted toxin-antitoxin system
MGVDMRVVRWLREEGGHEAVHLREEGLQRLPDLEIFAKAISEDRVVLTFDLDFSEIVAFTKGAKASVVTFRLHDTRTSHVIDRLASVLGASSEALQSGAIITVEDFRHRVRDFPSFGITDAIR